MLELLETLVFISLMHASIRIRVCVFQADMTLASL